MSATRRKWLADAPYSNEEDWFWWPRCSYPEAGDALDATRRFCVGPEIDDPGEWRVRLCWVVLAMRDDYEDGPWATEVACGTPGAVEGWVVEAP